LGPAGWVLVKTANATQHGPTLGHFRWETKRRANNVSYTLFPGDFAHPPCTGMKYCISSSAPTHATEKFTEKLVFLRYSAVTLLGGAVSAARQGLGYVARLGTDGAIVRMLFSSYAYASPRMTYSFLCGHQALAEGWATLECVLPATRMIPPTPA
jgi:hypothetical protein